MVVDMSVDDAANVRTMLCMPIVNANKDVIGVAQLINKVIKCHYCVNVRIVWGCIIKINKLNTRANALVLPLLARTLFFNPSSRI